MRIHPVNAQSAATSFSSASSSIQDALHGSRHQTIPAVRREQAETLNVQRIALAHGRRRDCVVRLLGELARVLPIVIEGTALEPADHPADHLGRVGRRVLPEDGAAEGTRDGGIEDAIVEGFLVVDGQEERVDPAQGGNVGFDDRDDRCGRVRSEDGRRREEVGSHGDGWVCAGGITTMLLLLLLLLTWWDGKRWCLRRRERRRGFGHGWCLRWRGGVPWRFLLLEKGQNRRLLGARHVGIVRGTNSPCCLLGLWKRGSVQRSKISHKEAMFFKTLA